MVWSETVVSNPPFSVSWVGFESGLEGGGGGEDFLGGGWGVGLEVC